MAFAVWGCGITLYGKRDFAEDGSYLTTEWATIFLVPLVPIRSLRVRDTGRPTGRWYFVYGWASREFLIYSRQFPSLRQVLFTYLYAIGLLTFLVAFFLVDVLPEGPVGLYRVLIVVGAGFWSLAPWVLRCRATRRERRPVIDNAEEALSEKGQEAKS